MAHIFDFPSLRRISGQELTLEPGRTTRIGIWGEDSAGRNLRLLCNEPDAVSIADHDPRRSGLEHFHVFLLRPGNVPGSGLRRVKLSAVTEGGHEWDFVYLTLAQHAGLVEMRRTRLISYARSLLGSHYVWGGTGDRPDQADGRPRPGTVHMEAETDTPHPMHEAAYCSVQTHHTCAGRCAHPAVRSQPQTQLFARYRQGRTVTAGVVYGESCRNVRHFDCVGFINHCLSYVMGGAVQQDIPGYRERAMAENPDPRELLAGDIVSTGGHIVFATGDRHQIHAASTDLGVIEEPINRAWTTEHKVTRFIV